jgi:hypothetical protein
MTTFDVGRAQQRVEQAALRAITAHHYFRDEDPHADAAAEYADEQLALAARDLVRAVEALPEDKRPIGWDEHSHGPFSTKPVTA